MCLLRVVYSKIKYIQTETFCVPGEATTRKKTSMGRAVGGIYGVICDGVY